MFSWVLSNKKNRGPMWYIIAMIVIGSLFLFGIVTQLYILSVVVILFAGTFLLIENNSSPITEIEISEKGLKVGENNYLWDDFVTFQMVEAGGSPVFLRFIPKKRISTVLDIPLNPEIDPDLIKNFLLAFFPE